MELFYDDQQRCSRSHHLTTLRRFSHFLFMSGPCKHVLSTLTTASKPAMKQLYGMMQYPILLLLLRVLTKLRSTGYSKNRITVMLSVKGDGTKLKPYILLPQKRSLPDLIAKYGGHVIMTFEGTNWLNQELTDDYLSKVISFPMLTPNRLLVSNSFKCHIIEATKKQ